MIKIKEEMSVEVIWNESEINKGTKRSAYPCCNSIECEPFPKCCDCTHWWIQYIRNTISTKSWVCTLFQVYFRTFRSASLAVVLLDLLFLSASTPTNSSAVSSGKTETRYSLVLAKFCMNSIKMTMHIENWNLTLCYFNTSDGSLPIVCCISKHPNTCYSKCTKQRRIMRSSKKLGSHGNR